MVFIPFLSTQPLRSWNLLTFIYAMQTIIKRRAYIEQKSIFFNTGKLNNFKSIQNHYVIIFWRNKLFYWSNVFEQLVIYSKDALFLHFCFIKLILKCVKLFNFIYMNSKWIDWNSNLSFTVTMISKIFALLFNVQGFHVGWITLNIFSFLFFYCL